MQSPAISALLIEDNPGDARLIREMVREAGASATVVDLTHVDRLVAGLESLANALVDVVLLDLSLPDSSGLDTFARLHAAVPGIAIVVLSGLDDQSVAVQAVQSGAQDYLVKGQVDGGSILRAMRYAIERQRLEATRQELERQRDELFASVSHDLRTPVAAIKAAIGVVLANEPPNMPPSLHRLLGNIELSADELGRLIEDLLEIARLQAGRVELWLTRVDLGTPSLARSDHWGHWSRRAGKRFGLTCPTVRLTCKSTYSASRGSCAISSAMHRSMAVSVVGFASEYDTKMTRCV
jgi:DNA-binding NarL/FixJ family response regulator